MPKTPRKPPVTQYFGYVSPQNVRSLNKHAALDLIRFTPGGVSRVELAHKMSLSRAAVTSIVNDLLATEIVREAESRSVNSGRPPIILEINPECDFVAGVDMGASHLNEETNRLPPSHRTIAPAYHAGNEISPRVWGAPAGGRPGR